MPDSADPADHPPKGSRARLALWVAGGGKIAPWCRKHGVPIRTAYRWSKATKFQAKVDEHRRRAGERAIGLLAKHAISAIEGMARLAKSAESESTKLSAQRGVLAELRDMTGFVELKTELLDLKRRLSAQEGRRAQRNP